MFDPACAANSVDAGFVLFKAWYKTVRDKTVRALSAIVTNEIQDDWEGKWSEKMFLFQIIYSVHLTVLSVQSDSPCWKRWACADAQSLW